MEPCHSALKDAGVKPNEVDEVILVGGTTRIPKVQNLVKELFGKEPHKGVNPDEVVALGAAIQAGVLAGEVKDVLLLDVTPLSLGIETLGGVTTKLIERNTTIPVCKSEIFSTAADNQTSVEVHVLQGEREMARDNRTLGRFHLTGIPPAPRGMPQIEVAFDIDANGIVNVSAKDLGTGKEQAITITASGGLAEEDVEKMVKEAEANREADRSDRETAEARNRLDNVTYSAEHTLQENRDKVPGDVAADIERAVQEGRGALESDNIERMKQAEETLTAASRRLAEVLYQQQTAGPGAGPPPGAGAGTGESGPPHEGEDVVDAEYREVE
jgi:molecular chaperone DnaK